MNYASALLVGFAVAVVSAEPAHAYADRIAQIGRHYTLDLHALQQLEISRTNALTVTSITELPVYPMITRGLGCLHNSNVVFPKRNWGPDLPLPKPTH